MMTPQQEARNLIDQPLPPLAEDLVELPTRIYAIDGMIDELERDLVAAREIVVTRTPFVALKHQGGS